MPQLLVQDLANMLSVLPAPTYNALGDVLIANTTTETSLFSSNYLGQGRTVFANRCQEGTIIKFTGDSLYTIPLLTPGSITVRVKVNGVTIMTTDTTSLASILGGATKLAANVRFAFHVRKVSGAWKLVPVGGLNFATPVFGRTFLDMLNGGTPIDFDPSINNTFDITIQWSAASVDRVLQVKSATINLEN